MDKDISFEITSGQIHGAENLRKSGNNADAAKLTEPAIRLNDYGSLDADGEKLVLAALRIYGTAQVSLSNGSVEAPEVAKNLNLAKKVFDLIFKNPNLAKAVKELKVNFEGQPDDLEAEFGRLEAKYLVTLSCLTGEASFLNIASEILNGIAEKSEEATAKTLAIYESARISFRSNKSSEQYKDLSKKYNEAFNAAYKAENWERSATESAWFVVDSAKGFHPLGVVTGLFDYLKSVIHNKGTWSIILRQVGKAITEDNRYSGWIKSTPDGVNYVSDLKLEKYKTN